MILLYGIIIALVVIALIYFYLSRSSMNSLDIALEKAAAGEFVDARGMIRSRLNRDPDDFQAHYTMSRIYGIEKKIEDELQHLKEIKRINRYSPEISNITVNNRIGEIYYKLEMYKDSYQHFLDSYNYLSNNVEALTFLSFMAVGQGQFEIAEKYFKKLIELKPEVSDYHVARGVCLSMLKNKNALEELEKGVKLNHKNVTARFLASLQGFKTSQIDKAHEHLEKLLEMVEDPDIKYAANRLAVGIFYLEKNYESAYKYAKKCLDKADKEDWKKEKLDAMFTTALMAILIGDLETAADHLTELEINNPTDENIIRLSDFRMDLEEGSTSIEKISPRGFDFFSFMVDWLRKRFPESAIYQLSGLKMDDTFDLLSFHTREKSGISTKISLPGFNPDELIERFNKLKGDAFINACNYIINSQGYKSEKELPNRDRDGADFIAKSLSDKSVKALFRIRQWENQPISDIFLRNMQNNLNELKVQNGFVFAGARLTTGAETALNNMKKITVVNEYDFGEILTHLFGTES